MPFLKTFSWVWILLRTHPHSTIEAQVQTPVVPWLFIEYGSLEVLDKQALSLGHHISQSWQNFCRLVPQHFPTLPCKMLQIKVTLSCSESILNWIDLFPQVGKFAARASRLFCNGSKLFWHPRLNQCSHLNCKEGGQFYFTILTNKFSNLNKYILQFEQTHTYDRFHQCTPSK